MFEAFFSIKLIDFSEDFLHVTDIHLHVFENDLLLKTLSEEIGYKIVLHLFRVILWCHELNEPLEIGDHL